jgi:hypothetical protein
MVEHEQSPDGKRRYCTNLTHILADKYGKDADKYGHDTDKYQKYADCAIFDNEHDETMYIEGVLDAKSSVPGFRGFYDYSALTKPPSFWKIHAADFATVISLAAFVVLVILLRR